MKSIHTKLKTDGFESWFFPSGESDRCVITLVDSEGNNIVNKALARWFGKHGCCSLGLGKWQDHTQRDGLHEWPLEYFGKAIDWLKTRGIKKIGFYGISFGGNMALLAASLYPDITLTVACEAIDIVMEGFEEGKKEGMSEWCCGKSTFTFQGEALPYLPYVLTEHQYYDRIVKSCKKHHELRSRELFQHAEKQAVPENCFIPIEQIHGRLLIIAAADDSMWESEKYAMRMEQRLASLPHPSEAEAVIYPYGTHLLLPYSVGRIGPLDIAALAVKLFRSGRKNGKECKESRKQLDALLANELIFTQL